QDGVEHREDRAQRADAESEGEHHCRGESTISSQHPQRITKIPPDLVDRSTAILVARFVLEALPRTKGEERRTSRRLVVHAGAHLSLRELVDMKLELLVEAPLPRLALAKSEQVRDRASQAQGDAIRYSGHERTPLSSAVGFTYH